MFYFLFFTSSKFLHVSILHPFFWCISPSLPRSVSFLFSPSSSQVSLTSCPSSNPPSSPDLYTFISVSLSQSFTLCFSCLGVDSAGALRRSFPQLTGGDREQTEGKQVDGGWEAEGGRGRRGGGLVDSSDMNNEKQTRRDGRRRGRWRGGMSLCGAIQKPRAIVEEEDDWRWKTGWRRGEVEGR